MAKKSKGGRTNAMRVLDARGIAYRTHTYPSERHSAGEVAAQIGLPEGQVFKTLVVLPEGPRPRPVLAILAGDRELDLKRLANAAGQKRLRMAPQKEAERLTGLLVGGISALALLDRGWPVFLDSSAREWPQIAVSAGQRGINLQLAVADLVALTGATVADISRAPARIS